MMRGLWRVLGALAVVLLVSGGAAAQGKDKIKVGFVYIGPIGDHGWTYRHDIGRKAIEEALGDKVETTYVENVGEGPDAERVIRQLAASGNDLIFGTTFGYMNPIIKVAKQFPDVKFEHATGYKRADNVSTYMARFYEGRYIAGILAGKMTKSNVIGYIGSFPIPEVVRGINSFMRGMQTVNPNAEVKIVWVNSWYDPGKEGDAAKAMIDQGADVILQHTDSPAAQQVAQERGVWSVGQASDMSAFAPKAHLTAIVDNWNDYYVSRAKAVLDGTWESMDTWGGLKAGMLEMAPYNEAIPAEVLELAKVTQAGIESGSIHPFQGPIKDQDGTLRVKEGEVLSDEELLKMDWYVEGIDDKLPQ